MEALQDEDYNNDGLDMEDVEVVDPAAVEESIVIRRKKLDPIAKILLNVAENVEETAKDDEKDTHGLDFSKAFVKRYRNNGKQAS